MAPYNGPKDQRSRSRDYLTNALPAWVCRSIRLLGFLVYAAIMQNAVMAKSQYCIRWDFPGPVPMAESVVVVGGGQVKPLRSGCPAAAARTSPLRHPLLMSSPAAHRRSDVTPYRKLSKVPASPCAMTSASRVMVSFKRSVSNRFSANTCNGNKQ